MADFKATVTLKDAYQRESTKRYQITAADVAAAAAALAAYVVDLANITEAEILKTTLTSQTVVVDNVDAEANIDEGVTFSFLKADGEKASVKVPAPLNAILTTTGEVDVSLLLVTNWANHFIGGPLYVSDRELATELLSGKLDR
ncbi:MAG: hypothetical protein MN733_24160 [Nitrososphaera sp.]|nr:hypothetical protein [Nitrososphaera sp.]